MKKVKVKSEFQEEQENNEKEMKKKPSSAH